MATARNDKQRRPGSSLRLCAIALALSTPVAHAADWKATPRLDLRETYTDNVTLGPAGSRQSDFVTQINPGISLSGTGARLKVNANYTLQNLIYARDSSRNTVNHQFGGSANAELAREVLFFDASASISQQNISLLAPIGIDNTSATGNRGTFRTYSLGPRLVHKFGAFAQGEARLSHEGTSSDVAGLNRSDANRALLSLRNGPAFNDVSWGANYSESRVEYSGRPNTRSSSASANLGYLLTPKFRVFANAGYERNDYLAVAADPNGRFWSAGAGWAPTGRTDLQASYGRRFYGNTYSLNFNHRTRRTVWNVNYSQDVTSTHSEQVTPGAVSARYYLDQLLVSRIPDDAQRQQAVELLMQFYRLPEYFPDSFALVTNQTFLSKQLRASIGVNTAKSLITLSAYHSIREALESGNLSSDLLGSNAFGTSDTIKQSAVSASWGWRFAPRTTSNFSANWTRNTFSTSDRQDDLWFVTLGLTRQFQPKLHGSLDLRHTQRESSDASSEYREESATAALNMTF